MSKYLGQRFSAFAFITSLTLGLAGCTAETLEEFKGEPVELAVNYTPGPRAGGVGFER